MSGRINQAKTFVVVRPNQHDAIIAVAITKSLEMNMRDFLRQTAFAVAVFALASGARAEGFSTSAVSPTPVPPTGLITGNYPPTDAETSYYFAVDLTAGDFVTQTNRWKST
jgi:hypothetical protein